MRGDQSIGWIILAAIVVWLLLEGVVKARSVLARIEAEQDWDRRVRDNGIAHWDGEYRQLIEQERGR